MKRFLMILAITMLTCAVSLPAAADVLWYNGDFNGVDYLSNEYNTLVSQSAVYDDFSVPIGGWTINTVWSNDMMTFNTASTAHWEIRSSVSAGNGGTLIASGDSPCTQTPTGRSSGPNTEYTIQVTGLNIVLAPGPYWLTVYPDDSGTGRSYNSITGGANAVGQPPGNDGNSFWDSTYYGENFAPTSVAFGYSPDFSMGVAGSAVPLPPAALLLASGLIPLVWSRRRKKLAE
jgi:hypothetical protein